MTHSVFAVSAALLALSCAGEVADLPDSRASPLPDGYVVLDDVARAAGWYVRVGGSCIPSGGVTPVSVPAEEWVLVGRSDGEAYEVEYLHPLAGMLISVHGADIELELIELTEPIAETDESEGAEGQNGESWE